MSRSWILVAVLAFASSSVACQGKEPEHTTPSARPTLATRPATAPQEGPAEQLIGPSTPASPPPATTVAEMKPQQPKVKTPSDERLPTWVPRSGRLSVVSAVDLAKNLGQESPASTDATIDHAAPAPATGSTWIAKNGRVTTRSARSGGRSGR